MVTMNGPLSSSSGAGSGVVATWGAAGVTAAAPVGSGVGSGVGTPVR